MVRLLMCAVVAVAIFAHSASTPLLSLPGSFVFGLFAGAGIHWWSDFVSARLRRRVMRAKVIELDLMRNRPRGRR